MAATTIQGPGVSVTMPTGFVLKANKIDGQLDIPLAPDTGFSDNGWYSANPCGPLKLSGTVSGVQQTKTNQPIPSALIASTVDPTQAQGSMTLTFASGCTLTFTANISQWKFARDMTTAMESSFPYESKGAVVLAWQTS